MKTIKNTTTKLGSVVDLLPKYTGAYLNNPPPKPQPKTIEQNMADITERLTNAGYDNRHQADFDKLVLAFANILSINGRGAVISGSVGCGKTMAIKAITRTNSVTECFNSVALNYLSMADQEHYHHDLIRKGEDLILDDIGSEDIVNNYGNKQNIIADFICNWHAYYTDRLRKDHAKRLFITTNLPITSNDKGVVTLISKYGLRVVDRLAEICDFVEMTGTTNRRKWVKY